MPELRTFQPVISASVNRKGVLDVDAVKGCTLGMSKYPDGGCYGLCYAAKMAALYGFDFTQSVSRAICDDEEQYELFDGMIATGARAVYGLVKRHDGSFFRIGTMGDPSHDWELTLKICETFGTLKTPVVVTKHWVKMPSNLLRRFNQAGAVFNTSISALDTSDEIEYRLSQFNRLRGAGIRSVLRIVSCRFGETPWGREKSRIQEELFNLSPMIDNPLRIPSTDPRVVSGDILTERLPDLRGKSTVSVAHETAYLGTCEDCPDQCGAN